MSSYIANHFNELEKKHYVRKTGGLNYWFDFRAGKMKKYRSAFGDNFCVVLSASDIEDDAYIIPFREFKLVFVDNLIDHRGRWTGVIKDNALSVYRYPSPSRFVTVSAYYNAFHYLEDGQQNGLIEELENTNFMEYPEINDPRNLRQKIIQFNKQYNDVIPYKRILISEQIARPGLISEYLKKVLGYKCQLCGEKGFLQKKRFGIY